MSFCKSICGTQQSLIDLWAEVTLMCTLKTDTKERRGRGCKDRRLLNQINRFLNPFPQILSYFILYFSSSICVHSSDLYFGEQLHAAETSGHSSGLFTDWSCCQKSYWCFIPFYVACIHIFPNKFVPWGLNKKYTVYNTNYLRFILSMIPWSSIMNESMPY